VAVDRGANGTASTQSSRNLLLSADAAIDTRPQLEILADAVKCSHGATTGSLDEQMLFYLLSRGLDRDTARAVLTYAFLGDVLAGFPVDVRTFVEGRALGRLPSADLIRGFVA
jgi:Fe-S cluster assembly protein SufD